MCVCVWEGGGEWGQLHTGIRSAVKDVRKSVICLGQLGGTGGL